MSSSEPPGPNGALRALAVQHHDYGPPARFADWAEARGLELHVAQPAAGERLPDPRGYDLALVLGSDESVVSEPRGWIADELNWLREADHAGVALLGICFGGQVLARAFGGTVERTPEPEVGWFTLAVADGSEVPEGPWFMWHEDHFTPPPGAVELARTDRYSQAFGLRSHLAVQFHPEVTDELIDTWSRMEKRRELRELRPDLLERPDTPCGGQRDVADALFDVFLRRAGLDGQRA